MTTTTDTTTTAPETDYDGDPVNPLDRYLPDDRPRLILGIDRANRYAGECRVCSQTVAADEGVLIGRTPAGSGSSSRWEIQHRALQDCREACRNAAERADTPAVVAAPSSDMIERGQVWVVPTSTGRAGSAVVADQAFAYYRVSRRQRTGSLYLNRWNGYGWSFAGYVTGSAGRSILAGATEATARHASAFGAAFSRCVFCGRELDTPESITVGYGPTCAAQRNLPWGSVTAEQAGAARSLSTARRNLGTIRTAPRSRPVAALNVGECGCVECGEEFATETEARRENHPCVA